MGKKNKLPVPAKKGTYNVKTAAFQHPAYGTGGTRDFVGLGAAIEEKRGKKKKRKGKREKFNQGAESLKLKKRAASLGIGRET